MKTLKNNIWMMSLMLSAMFGFTSCDLEFDYYYDEDAEIGYTINGHWFGDLDMYNAYTGEKAQGSEIEFYRTGGNYYRGTGVEVDYYYRTRPVTNYFNWEVYDSALYLYFEDSDLDCVIYEYRLTDTSFTGYMEGYDGYNTRFSLRNYDRYWDDYGYGYYYTRAASEESDTTTVKGIRGCKRGKGE